MSPASPSLRRVPWGRFPGFIGTMLALTPRRPSRELGLPCLALTMRCPTLCSHRVTDTFAGGPGRLGQPAPTRLLLHGDDGASQVPGEPQCASALLYDPGGGPDPGHDGSILLPPLHRARRPPVIMGCFGARSHSFRTRCLRFAVPIAGPHARLASGWWLAFAGQALDLPGSFRRFPVLSV